MSKLIDLTGQKFGRLTVLYKDNNRKTNSGSYWICKCDCGKIKSVKSSSLRRGEIQSCGCYRNEQSKIAKEEMGLVDNLTGQKFGFLTVLKKDPVRANGGAVKWICQCKCGNIVSVRGASLKDKTENRTVSCGCAHLPIGELQIKEILDINNISYSQQQSFSSLPNRRFDFCIFDENNQILRLIEFDGEFHYIDKNYLKDNLNTRQQRDIDKNNWCQENNIPLVRIPYWERDKITLEMILGDQYLI